MNNKRYPAVIRTLSSGGIGLELLDVTVTRPYRGDAVKVRVDIGRNAVELPGKVVWRSKESQQLGIRLLLEIAGNRFRADYERWIDQIASAIEQESCLAVASA